MPNLIYGFTKVSIQAPTPRKSPPPPSPPLAIAAATTSAVAGAGLRVTATLGFAHPAPPPPPAHCPPARRPTEPALLAPRHSGGGRLGSAAGDEGPLAPSMPAAAPAAAAVHDDEGGDGGRGGRAGERALDKREARGRQEVVLRVVDVILRGSVRQRRPCRTHPRHGRARAVRTRWCRQTRRHNPSCQSESSRAVRTRW